MTELPSKFDSMVQVTDARNQDDSDVTCLIVQKSGGECWASMASTGDPICMIIDKQSANMLIRQLLKSFPDAVDDHEIAKARSQASREITKYQWSDR